MFLIVRIIFYKNKWWINNAIISYYNTLLLLKKLSDAESNKTHLDD